MCVCDSLSAGMYALHPQTDRQTESCIQKLQISPAVGLVSETLSFSESPGLGFMTRSGAMQAREPTPRASCVCGSSREGGGAILVPTQCTEQVPCIFCRYTSTPTLTKMLRREVTSTPPIHQQGGALGFCSMHEAHQTCSSSAPLPLHITLCITVHTPTFRRNFLVCRFCALRWRLMET